MKKVLISFALFVGVSVSAEAAIQTFSASDTGGATRTKLNSNFSELDTTKETKAVVQASAPGDLSVDWYDTDQEPGILVLKKHNGTTWVRASSYGVQYQSSCASITAGMCVDTDDGKLYYHNGTAVVEVSGGGTGGTGDIEGVTAGTGLSGGGTTGTVTVAINPAYTQRRVASSCSAGTSIRAIAEDGTVTCETDDTGSGFVPSGTVNGQVLLWSTDQWAASTPPWVTTASLGTGVGTWLATPSGANLASALTSALPASKGGTGLTSLGTGVGTALAAAVDGTGGLASKASLDALPNIIFGTGLTVSEDTPLAGTDTISVQANTYQAYDANMIAWPSTISATEVGYLNGLTEALSTSLAGKQAADADLTTAAGATGSGISKYFGTNSSGTAGFYDLPSGGGGSGYVLGLGSIFKNTAVSGAVGFCGITSPGESSSSFARSATPIPATGTATVAYAYVSTSDAQPATGSQVCTLHVNDAATGMVITITSSGSGIFTSSGTASVSAGDRAAWSCANNAAASAGTITSIVISVQ